MKYLFAFFIILLIFTGVNVADAQVSRTLWKVVDDILQPQVSRWPLQIGGDSASSTEFRMLELSGNGTNFYSFKVPDSISANVELTWNVNASTCTGDGNGGVLTVNGSNEIICDADDGGAGGSGDSVRVDSTAIDTTADFESTGDIDFVVTDGGAGGPDDITANINADVIDFAEFSDTPALDANIELELGSNDVIINSSGGSSTLVIDGGLASTSIAELFVSGSITGSLTGNADTATALAANGANCSAGQWAAGVDASGAAEGCTADDVLTEEEVEDFVGGMLGGTETGISVTYQDATNDIDFVVDNLENLAGTLDVGSGGTGATSLTDGGVLLGSGTGAITAMSVLADGEIIVGDGTTDPVAESGATARASLGLTIGGDVQAYDDELRDVASSTPTKGDIITSDGTDWIDKPVGTNAYIIMASSTAADGWEWVPCATLTGSADLCDGSDDGGGGGGDNVTVNSTAVDTTANFLDSIYGNFDIADGGAGGPDDVTFTIEYGQTLAGNPALAVDQCIPFADTSGGGFLCEGSTANTNEQLYRLPDADGADTTEYIVVADDANVSATEAGYLDGVTSAIQTQLDAKEVQLDNEAGLYAVLSDVTNFLQTGDALAGDDITDGSVDASEIGDDTIDFAEILYTNTLAGNPSLAVDECYFLSTTTGGGFICEGSTANTNEQLYLFPDVDGADTTNRIVVDNTEVTSIDGDGLTISGGVLTADLGTAIVTGEITDGTILEPDLDADVAATDGDWLQYDSTGTNFTWRSDTELASDAEPEIEAAIDTLANLTSIQGLTVTLADAGADAILGWDDTASAYENLTQAEVLAIIGGASTSAQGVVELATAAETTTGTDATRAVTPDGLAGSDYGTRVLSIEVFGPSTAVANGDGKKYFRIPSVVDGYNIISVAAQAVAASSSGADMEIQFHNASSSADLLSTKLFIDVNEKDSSTAATSSVINTSNDAVVTAEQWRVDVDAGDGIFDGLVVELQFQKP